MALDTRLVPEDFMGQKCSINVLPGPVVVREGSRHHHLSQSTKEEEKPEDPNKVEQLEPRVEGAWAILIEDTLGLRATRATKEGAWVTLVSMGERHVGQAVRIHA